ncbi:DUF1501 domain-containing protein [Vibrio sp. 10N.261.55.A7]|uniref:DUF1501 domain-containing protein n=1 Tax=Vibrio sp. 10N.261.55.A7 TaxID=1880851 RepID=UPI000C857D6E|nr:DUF1501 domain-containing protein [Vibrio sp. 10N.261.55.A7]PMJ89679.1 Tat pathway signal protein [Vibrio sp. 10N.261.55.A7]
MKLSRRSLLASLGGLTVGGLMPGHSYANSQTDYKALVCINLAGGNDALNTIVPTDDKHYQEYEVARPSIAVKQADLTPIGHSVFDRSGSLVQLGLHPKLSKLSELFSQHRAMAIINSGILKEPMTKQEIEDQLKPLPPQLFSHNSQTHEWEKGGVGVAPNLGWAGRMLDVLGNQSTIAPLYSITNNTLWLRSAQYQQNILKLSGTAQIEAVKHDAIAQSYSQLVNSETTNPFIAHMRNMMGDALYISQTLDEQLKKVPSVSGFTQSDLGKQFQYAYKLIKSQQSLGQSRQVIYLKQAGYDLHNNQLLDHPRLLEDLAINVAAFDSALQGNNLSDQVTTFTTSEFGRRIASNGKGTDHGWGGHQFVFGGALNSASSIGEWPEIKVNGSDDISNGRLVPTIAADQVNATFAKWMGVNTTEELKYVFPNIDNFSDKSLGFLG